MNTFTLPAGYYIIYDPVLLFTNADVLLKYQSIKNSDIAESDLMDIETWYSIADELKEHQHVIHNEHEIWGGLLPKTYTHPDKLDLISINNRRMFSLSGFIIITKSNVIRINRTFAWADYEELDSNVPFDIEFNYDEGLIKMGPYEIR